MDWKKIVSGAFGIGVSVAAVYFLLEKIDFQASWEMLQEVGWGYILALMLLYLSTFPIRALRWKLMLEKLIQTSFINFNVSLLIGFAGNNLIPARGGEVMRVHAFQRLTKGNWLTIISSVLTEKILDGVAMLLLLLSGVFLARDYDFSGFGWFSETISIVTVMFVGALTGVLVIRIFGKQLMAFLTKNKGSIGDKIGGILDKVYGALSFLNIDVKTLAIVVLSLTVWFVEGSMFMLGAHALQIDVPIIAAGLIALAIVNFGLIVPSSPAYVGVFQAMTIMAFKLFDIADNEALSLALMVHFCQFLPVTVLGIIAYLSKMTFNNDNMGKRESVSERNPSEQLV